jgi:DNA-directed RNA polymerase subunit RPC12/RpoP
MREFTCGACGETFGTNCVDEDIMCPECDAQRCPHCGKWFGGEDV